jgi:hypothetical protein
VEHFAYGTHEPLPEESPVFAKNAVAPFEPWQPANLALKMSGVDSGEFAAFYGGRISPEHLLSSLASRSVPPSSRRARSSC